MVRKISAASRPARKKRNVIDLIQIVVGRGQPEYGNAIGAGAGGFTGQFDRAQSFEKRKQRAAEKADLLSRDQGGRAAAQAINIFQSLGDAPHALFCRSRMPATCSGAPSHNLLPLLRPCTIAAKCGERE